MSGSQPRRLHRRRVQLDVARERVVVRLAEVAAEVDVLDHDHATGHEPLADRGHRGTRVGQVRQQEAGVDHVEALVACGRVHHVVVAELRIRDAGRDRVLAARSSLVLSRSAPTANPSGARPGQLERHIAAAAPDVEAARRRVGTADPSEQRARRRPHHAGEDAQPLTIRRVPHG